MSDVDEECEECGESRLCGPWSDGRRLCGPCKARAALGSPTFRQAMESGLRALGATEITWGRDER